MKYAKAYEIFAIANVVACGYHRVSIYAYRVAPHRCNISAEQISTISLTIKTSFPQHKKLPYPTE